MFGFDRNGTLRSLSFRVFAAKSCLCESSSGIVEGLEGLLERVKLVEALGILLGLSNFLVSFTVNLNDVTAMRTVLQVGV